MADGQQDNSESMSDEEAIAKIAAAMKDNAPNTEDKVNVHTFLRDVVITEDVTRVGNLRDDKEIDELGRPNYTVRGSKDMQLISDKIMKNDFFAEYFEQEAQNTLATSLSRNGFLVRQASTQVKQVADITKRRKINKGWFGKTTTEETGGDPNTTGGSN
jgi:osmotically-inducible protein OsmY